MNGLSNRPQTKNILSSEYSRLQSAIVYLQQSNKMYLHTIDNLKVKMQRDKVRLENLLDDVDDINILKDELRKFINEIK